MTSAELSAINFDTSQLRISFLSSKDDDRRPISFAYTDIDRSINGDDDESNASNVPRHPIPLMQDAFAESLEEVTHGGAGKPKLRELDALGRRDRLLEQQRSEPPWDALWRYRHGQTQHEAVKLISQISFGVYLLLNGMANDNAQVVNILQGHIDEVDEFLEVNLEDLAQAKVDLTTRLDHLRLPLGNRRTFESLLEDRTYRIEILEGNEAIEHVVGRMDEAAKMWNDDIEAGQKCSLAFTEWLDEQKHGAWAEERPELEDIYLAMTGNAEGWRHAFDEMNTRTQGIMELTIKLTNVVTDIERTAGEVSRRTAANVQPYSSPNGSIASPPSTRSPHRSTPRHSIRSGTPSTVQPFRRTDSYEESDFGDYPLPGAAPLLPPTRYSGRPAAKVEPPRQRMSSRSQSRSSRQSGGRRSGEEEAPMFLLQPRTYSPKVPEPLPSPMLNASGNFSSIDQRSSMRNRVSHKSTPPQAIHIPPPRAFAETRSAHQPSPTWSSPPRTSGSNTRDSAYGSDAEPPHHYHHSQQRRPSHNSSTISLSRPPLRPAPNSDNQFYRPVRASPHSPLQQRPHTAMPTERQSSFSPPRHIRNRPSRLGGMSMLSVVETAAYEGGRPVTPGAATVHGGGGGGGAKGLKKKKSALGWLKKAFTMDEEERAAFESKKTMQSEGKYYSSGGQKFLDGRRVR